MTPAPPIRAGQNALRVAVKAAHSGVLVVMTGFIAYTVYCAATGNVSGWLWLGVGLVVAEGAVWFAFGRRCPLTTWAKRLGDPTGDDYLVQWLLPPRWVPRLVPTLMGVFLAALAVVLVRLGGRF